RVSASRCTSRSTPSEALSAKVRSRTSRRRWRTPLARRPFASERSASATSRRASPATRTTAADASRRLSTFSPAAIGPSLPVLPSPLRARELGELRVGQHPLRRLRRREDAVDPRLVRDEAVPLEPPDDVALARHRPDRDALLVAELVGGHAGVDAVREPAV